MEVQPHKLLTSALDGDEWSASRPEREPQGTHWVGGWMGHRAALYAVAMRKISFAVTAGNRNPIVKDAV